MSPEATPTPPASNGRQEEIAGSVKPYEQHLAICTGAPPELWAARVEEMEGLFERLHAGLQARKLDRKIKLTACDAPSTGAEGFDIFLLPDMLVLPEITEGKVEALVGALEKQFEQGLPFDVQPMAGGDHLFVCTHENRDARCGEWGPRLYEALRREIVEQDAIAHVHRTSHIGGHSMAATCIIYPQGIWYGNLRPDDARRLVAEHLNHERLLPDRYRGRLGTTACQQVAEATAAAALLARFPDYDSLSVEVVEEGKQARARAVAMVPTAEGLIPVVAEFRLSCPLVFWSSDDEPTFVNQDGA